MDSSLLCLFLLGALALPETRAGSHSLRYLHAAWTRPELGEPRFITVGFVDDEELVRFDSDAPRPRLEPRAAWMERMEQVDPGYWERNTGVEWRNVWTFRVSLETLRGYYNQSQEGVHTLQFLHGCEVSPDGRLQRSFSQFAYDGRDYIALDTETSTWIAAVPQAVNTKHKWEARREAERYKTYLEETCVHWVRKYLEMGKETLTRTDPPSARMTHHTTPDGEVTLRCWTQDFYPTEISLTWLRNGEEQLQDTEFIETRPGGDGTFQKWAAVGVTPGQEGRYSCRVQHKGLAEPLILKWEPPPSSTWIILGVIAGAIFLLTVVGVVIWKKNQVGRPGGGSPRSRHHGEYGPLAWEFVLLFPSLLFSCFTDC
ncbi:BOLA class I histocompatibility antigen, alpha chain BL3-7-like [Macrotis lagotis]|uniref:BOLA class I histocompatibility antigen, alpha chain BL3-7-like n=1 Tax=Macrotis lagotis TaxID=92651 RepID=UPI003D689AE5